MPVSDSNARAAGMAGQHRIDCENGRHSSRKAVRNEIASITSQNGSRIVSDKQKKPGMLLISVSGMILLTWAAPVKGSFADDPTQSVNSFIVLIIGFFTNKYSSRHGETNRIDAAKITFGNKR